MSRKKNDTDYELHYNNMELYELNELNDTNINSCELYDTNINSCELNDTTIHYIDYIIKGRLHINNKKHFSTTIYFNKNNLYIINKNLQKIIYYKNILFYNNNSNNLWISFKIIEDNKIFLYKLYLYKNKYNKNIFNEINKNINNYIK